MYVCVFALWLATVYIVKGKLTIPLKLNFVRQFTFRCHLYWLEYALLSRNAVEYLLRGWPWLLMICWTEDGKMMSPLTLFPLCLIWNRSRMELTVTLQEIFVICWRVCLCIGPDIETACAVSILHIWGPVHSSWIAPRTKLSFLV